MKVPGPDGAGPGAMVSSGCLVLQARPASASGLAFLLLTLGVARAPGLFLLLALAGAFLLTPFLLPGFLLLAFLWHDVAPGVDDGPDTFGRVGRN